MATVTVPRWGLYIDGRWRDGPRTVPVLHKYRQEVLAEVVEADEALVDEAVQAAQRALEERPLSPYRRFEILRRAADLLSQRREEFALTIAREAGKPLKYARVEVDRALQTISLSGEEAKRIHGEQVPVEAAPGGEGRLAFTLRVPVGVVCAISPFNFPLNLVAHKVGPALAAGNAVVLKPATYTPLTSLMLAQLLEEAGLPPGYLNVVVGGGRTVGEALLRHPGIALYTFTGSPEVGERIKAATGLRRVILELGNNSPNIVAQDANLDQAAQLLARFAYLYAGQFCISVQRIYVE
ncbi:MAG: aldehyde dehydrogenase family protein, partial [Armatimonadota bacterium]|nr:aldehyde dehydrogenase family protein [Armatimonadota bacterium]